MMPNMNHTDLIRDMMELDREYIPALELTRYGDATSARQAMTLLMERWRQFKARYYEANTDDEYWKSDFDFVSLMVAEAHEIVHANEELFEAHRTLAGVRKVFMQLRLRNDLDYFLDYLTAFHDPMETIVQAAMGATPQSLTITDVDTMRVALPEAFRLWEKVRQQHIDAALFGLRDEQQAQMQHYMEAESEALERLQHVLERIDKEVDEALIIRLALDIRPNFARLFALFGDFARFGGVPTIR